MVEATKMMEEETKLHIGISEEESMQQLRSKATELLLREEWKDSIEAYSNFITLCKKQIFHTHLHSDNQLQKLRKSLCLAFSNRAEARSRLREFQSALEDCDSALEIDGTHLKTLICKGKILLNLNVYSMALDCFRLALLDPQANGNSENLNGYVEKCKKLDFLSRTGALDLSDWVSNGFRGKCPELAEFVGSCVQIKRSEISGRGLFATKNIDAGTLVLVTKAIAMERSILGGKDLSEEAQLVMWKNFIDKVSDFIRKCHRTGNLISKLSSGEDEEMLEVPDIALFKPETGENKNKKSSDSENEKVDMGKLLSILDVNSLTEDAVSANVLGNKSNDFYGVGLWLLPSFINHSCCPNSRRLHVGDYLILHASKDIKAGEEITFAYFDPLSPLHKRKEMSMTWGIQCRCKRCKFESEMLSKQEMKEIEIGIERGMDVGGAVYKLEEEMKRWKVRGKEKGYVRASFWAAYSEVYRSDRCMKRWGRRIPAMEAVVYSIIEVMGGDERLLKIVMEEMKKNGGGLVEMEKALKLARDVYGKVVKKQAMRALLELCVATND
ncbi:putative histone-lysine N-methyltransferase chromatin remodeling SET family [Senna tora]|uniref:Putative histone-lysine N-methyltransferase chromatin remodeling SET family n=1 Tax=Senna tora TaxID=362788 RepID=A0A834TWJ9_9FABA|nr:putative histone-lysine N-methyltransferase chromatin remodeling SET family [Senna tora]